jgi:D-lactate dehydrogenase
MKVLAYDPYPVEELKEWGVEYVELEELYKKSHVISLHCPQTEENRHLINKESLSNMKNGVYIVNTSRGALIDTAALIENLLIPGKIGGIALDVYEDESGVFYEDKSNEVIHDEKLARLVTFPNVLITSHQGYFTKEAMETICLETLRNARAFEEGEELVNEVK